MSGDKCPDCNGEGELAYRCACACKPMWWECGVCGNSGQDVRECGRCGGTGSVEAEEEEDEQDTHH